MIGKSDFGSIGWKGWPTVAGFVLSVACFPCLGTEDDASKVVEAAASVLAVSVLTSGVGVVDADESTLWSTTFVEGLAACVELRFWECLVATRFEITFCHT